MAFKFITAEEAAEFIHHNDNVGFSGFTAAGTPKVVSVALAKKAEAEHAAGRPFQIGVYTGASTSDYIDGALSRAKAIKSRTPYQSHKDSREAINNNEIAYFDLHLSHLAQTLRYGFLGKVDVAVIEATDVTPDGEILLGPGVGATPTFCSLAEKIIIELNHHDPKELRGMHDIYQPLDPPYRREIPIYKPSDRIGVPVVKVDPKKIIGIVESDKRDGVKPFAPVDEVTMKIGNNVCNFLAQQLKSGLIPPQFLPLQSGVGNIANAVLACLGSNPDIPAFEMYTEVVQDAVIDLMKEGKCKFASSCSLTVSDDKLNEVFQNIGFFHDKIILRPGEITNNPEVERRIGLNAYLSIFTCPSTAKGGKISAIVPMVSHLDHSEHSVQVLITEQGVADLRGKSPIQRAHAIIENCAHPMYKELLWDYLKLGKGHTPHRLNAAFAFHNEFLKSGDMALTNWADYE